MAENTLIEWTDGTINFWVGCQEAGPGCKYCYAQALDTRFGHGENWGPKAPRRKTKSGVADIKKMQRNADKFEAEHGRKFRVFVSSMCDIFDNAVPLGWTYEALDHCERADKLEIQLLTKRVGQVEKRMPARWRHGWPRHIGLMITVVNQEEADRDIPKLLELKEEFNIPWVGLSIEPMLGPIDLTNCVPSGHAHGSMRSALSEFSYCELCGEDDDLPTVDWVIIGGESGRFARPAHIGWIREVVEDCKAAKVPLLFKQWGEWFPYGQTDAYGRHNTVTKGEKPGFWHEWPEGGGFSVRIGKKKAGRYLDGIIHNEFPRISV